MVYSKACPPIALRRLPSSRQREKYAGYDVIEGDLFIYMEHLPGGPVRQLLEDMGPFSS